MTRRLLDAHTHFFSREFFRLLAVESAAARGLAGPEEPLQELARKTGIEIPEADPRVHAGRWVQELDRHGVERAVTIASHPGEEDAVREGARAAGGRLVPVLLVDPRTEAGVARGIRALTEGGYRGVLLFPAIHRVAPADPGLDPLFAAAGSRNALVIVHCGILEIKVRDLLGIRPAYDLGLATPLAVSAAAERHPRTRFLIPHFGAGFFRETLLAGAQTKNLYVDTSSSNSWRRAQPESPSLEQVFRKTIEVFGPRRILFGTDSSTFPRGWRAPIREEQEAALAALGAAEGDRERILGGNLAEILNE
jgi:predicted TIM-barrel fold metal-dependent hydrolase